MATLILDEDEYPATAFSIGFLLVWLIPRLYIDWNRTLRKVPPEAFARVHQHALVGISGHFLVLATASGLVAYYTQGLDTRMGYILSGTSRILVAMICLAMSLELPQWLGVYDYVKIIQRAHNGSSEQGSMSPPKQQSLKEILFDFQWGIFGQFCRIFWIVLLFSCGHSKYAYVALPLAFVCGILLGCGITWGVYYGRTHVLSPRRLKIATFVSMGFLVCVACLLVGVGSWFIQEVWQPQAQFSRRFLVFLIPSLSCLVLSIGLHIVAYRTSRRQLLEKERNGQHPSEVAAAENIAESSCYESSLFSPDTIKTAVKEVTPVALPEKAKKVVLKLQRSHGDSNRRPAGQESEDIEKPAPLSVTHTAPPLPAAEEEISSPSNRSPETTTHTNLDTTPGVAQDVQLREIEQANTSGNKVDDDGVTSNNGDEENTRTTAQHEVEEEPSLASLFLAKLQCYHCCHRCCSPCWRPSSSKPKKASGFGWSRLSTLGRIAFCVKWTTRIVGHGICIYAVIVNIGATQQGLEAKRRFPDTDRILYQGQEDGPVCAYHEDFPFEDSYMQTFENVQAVPTNYTLAHCGACASCSTWQNLELQWTTRQNLAILSEKCAKVLVWKGYDASLQCHLDTIGFDEACSACWVDVEGCAAKNCAFIQMQSWMIDNLGNFEVGPDLVTSAMCEEAICETTFVPCSGANRRRMNIVSDIARPGTQQCPLIPDGNAKWLDLFGPEDPFIGKK